MPVTQRTIGGSHARQVREQYDGVAPRTSRVEREPMRVFVDVVAAGTIRRLVMQGRKSQMCARFARCLAARRILLAVFTILGGVPVYGGAAAPIPIPDLVKGFSPLYQYAISPDGRYLLRRDLRDLHLKVFPVGESGEVGEAVDLARHRFRFLFWARDGSRLYGIRYRERTPVVLAIDPARPRARVRDVALPDVTGRVVSASLHPKMDDRLILWTFGRNGEDILHCDLNGDECVSVAPVSAGAGGWRSIVDEAGQPVARHRFTGAGFEFQARRGEDWRAAGEMENDRIMKPLSLIDADGWGVALSNRVQDTFSLVRRNVYTLEERAIYSIPEADVSHALLSDSYRPLAVTSFPGYPRTIALQPAAERALDLVRARHAEPALLNLASADATLTRFVVEVFDEVRARVVYLVTLPQDTVEEFDSSPAGSRFREDFSTTRAVRIPARDGLSLPSLLTLPRDRQGSEPPPLVLFVHGGPWLLYKWTFDPIVQILASRGYAVLKVNYRGSFGYGNRFREAAVGELTGRVQEDVEDAVDWAVREGYADPSRLAMFGDSFGGFCVLAAMIRGRLPVRAGVVVSGVVDTEAMVEENTFSPEGQALWAKYLGTGDVEEMRRILREVSPLRHVDRIRAPVLLLTGNTDRIVQSRHAAALARELRKRGQVAKLVSFPREGHTIRRERNVIETYREMVEFLGRHLD